MALSDAREPDARKVLPTCRPGPGGWDIATLHVPKTGFCEPPWPACRHGAGCSVFFSRMKKLTMGLALDPFSRRVYQKRPGAGVSSHFPDSRSWDAYCFRCHRHVVVSALHSVPRSSARTGSGVLTSRTARLGTLGTLFWAEKNMIRWSFSSAACRAARRDRGHREGSETPQPRRFCRTAATDETIHPVGSQDSTFAGSNVTVTCPRGWQSVFFPLQQKVTGCGVVG